MKRFTVFSLILAGALVLFGAGLFAGAMTVGGWDFSILSSAEFITNTYEITEPFADISIQSDTADISFVKTTDANARVECADYSYLEYTAEVRNGTLYIECKDVRQWYDYIHFSIFTQSNTVTVYLPESAYGTLNIKESTGDIKVPADFSFDSMDLYLRTGDVSVQASRIGICKINTDTGDISVQNTRVDSLTLHATTGDIAIGDVACAGDIGLRVTTGRTVMKNVTCRSLTSDGTTGDIKLKNVIASGAFDIERSSGDVTFDQSDAASIKIQTDTGDVTGSLLSDKVFIYRTDTGDVDLPDTTTGGKCDISTDTGDIEIRIYS